MCIKRLLAVCLWALASHGCQWLSHVEAKRSEDAARADHAACTASGFEWPSAAYVDCRRFRVDARQREMWQELQMSHRQQQPEIGIVSPSPTRPYRPVRAADFRCREVAAADGGSYIACRESDGKE